MDSSRTIFKIRKFGRGAGFCFVAIDMHGSQSYARQGSSAMPCLSRFVVRINAFSLCSCFHNAYVDMRACIFYNRVRYFLNQSICFVERGKSLDLKL